VSVTFSILDESFQADPAATFAALRERCPVHRTEEPAPHHTLSRERDVRAALRDDVTWSSKHGPGLAYADPARPTGVLVSSDPPLHTAERLAISRLFRPSVVEAMAGDVRSLTGRILDDLAPRGRGDLVRDLAMPLPLTVMCWLLGTPVADIERFRSWVLPMAEGVSYVKGSMDPRAADAYREFGEYFTRHIAERRRAIDAGETAPEDLLTRLLGRMSDGEGDERTLSPQQVLGFCQFLLVAGSATTTLLIANVVHRLLEHPDQLELVRADRSLVPSAIEESLRFDAPVHGLFRTNTCPVTLHDVEIPEASKVLMLFGSANRDPEAWDEPDRFDVTRDPQVLRRHHAFGLGIHVCLGAPLARLEGAVALEAVLDRLPGLRRDGDGSRVRAAVLHGFESYPVAWDAARATAGAG